MNTESELNRLKNEVKYLRKSILWYQDTFEKRSLAGIVKDRIFKKIGSSNFFYRRINGYHRVKKTGRKTGIGKRILCAIVNYDCNDNALLLRSNLSVYFDTIIFDAGSPRANRAFVNVGKVYYSGLLNHAFQCARVNGYDFLFFICSDVEFSREEIETMVSNLESLDLNEIGLYSPSSTGRSHSFCKKNFRDGLRAIPFAEGFVFIAAIDVLEQYLPTDLNINLYGWGLDLANGYFSRKLGKLCVIDDAVSVFHPESTGYSNAKAEEDMWHWINTLGDDGFKTFFEKYIEIIREGLVDQLKISVIIPCYNQAAYLKECVYSVLKQEFSNFEILIINDGSTDDTALIGRTLECEFPQVKCINKENGGLGSARNLGIKESTGNYIQFLDADDLISSEKFLAHAYSILINKHNDILYSPYLCFEDGNKENQWTYSRMLLKEDPCLDIIQNWEKDLSIPVHCFLYSREIVSGIFFDEELPNHEDWLFHMLVAGKNGKYHFEGNGIAYYRVRQQSMARDTVLMQKGKLMCLQKAIGSTLVPAQYLYELNKRIIED